jgi:hypothetical protein
MTSAAHAANPVLLSPIMTLLDWQVGVSVLALRKAHGATSRVEEPIES